MVLLRIVVPAVVTIVLTFLAVAAAVWLMGLVPAGEWSDLIKAGIGIFIIGSTLLVIAWSAYFAYIIRQSLRSE